MGKAYWAAAAVIGAGALAATAAIAGAVGSASAPSAPPTYEARRPAPAERLSDKAAAVERCFARVQDRLSARGAAGVTLAALERAWPGSEGWIVDVSVDVAREGRRARRQAFTCRQSQHGLHVARG